MQLSIILILVVLSIWTIGVASQFSDPDIHFRPKRLVWVKNQWFQHLLADNAQQNISQLLIRNISEAKCDRSCWESEYQYSYLRNSTQECLCSNEYPSPADVNEQQRFPPYDDVGSVAKFTSLNAEMFEIYHPCYRNLITVNPISHADRQTVEGCLSFCGEPTLDRPSIYTAVIPSQHLDAGGYQDVYSCWCYDTRPSGETNECGYWLYHLFGKFFMPD
ncbi:uncharacterized protein L201_001069 [Kwoniella dendrophila CBS 6074]|uniref:WSC domain-containing protein n=1 Tax=Kwoniella dendrophila CBS 6074 TaxID=1295534 RepID=A0AAX4JMF2_9TREE